MICIPIIADNVDDAIKDMTEASRVADVVELRLDYMKNPNLNRLLENRNKPVIVTYRPFREGGKYEGNEEDRIAVLKLAIRLGTDFVDIEHDTIQNIGKESAYISRNKTKIIVSYHNFRETPDNLLDVYKKLSLTGTDIVKIVTYANDITDNVKIYRLLQQTSKPLISFCMGEYGLISRILYKEFGSYLTFASLQKGVESAPGQIAISELLSTYRIREQDKQTAIYGLIGDPVLHSIGPVIHNALFKQMGFNNIYVPFKVNNVDNFIKIFKLLNVKGYSVTIPHKESVINSLDEIAPLAGKIGAVNTIVNNKGRFIGYNTDCEAAIKALGSVFEVSGRNNHLKGKKVTLLGAGGAARAIAFGLKEYDASITILNRNIERARLLARDVGCSYGEFDYILKNETDILVNATPVGMYPAVNEIPIPEKMLRPNMIVFDTIYNPVETRLLREAKAIGCKTVGGLPMFAYQAAAQFKLWTGQMPSVEKIEKIASERLVSK